MWAVDGLCVYFVFSFTQWAGGVFVKVKSSQGLWVHYLVSDSQIFVTTVWFYKQMAAISAVSSK